MTEYGQKKLNEADNDSTLSFIPDEVSEIFKSVPEQERQVIKN